MNVRPSPIPTGNAGEGFLQRVLFKYSEADVAGILPAFWWAADRLNRLSPSEFLDSSPRSPQIVELLREYVHSHRRNATLDYGDAQTFVYFDTSYFYRNFLKCLLGAHCLRSTLEKFNFLALQRSTTVIDVGSGVGTFSIACRLLHLFQSSKFLLIDKYPRQVQLARELTAHFGLDRVEFLQSDIFSLFDRRGLLIASYWLCGNRKGVLDKSDADLRRVLSDGLVLIDYQSNLYEFIDRIRQLRPKTHLFEICAPLPESTRTLVGSRGLNVHMLVIEPMRP